MAPPKIFVNPIFVNGGVVILGAIIGSFLNCLIYRLPRSISLIAPERSFCPACKRMLPWQENLPLLSWLFLQGRCSGCQAPISFRYILVEAISAFLFWLCYVHVGFPLAIAGWVLISLLIVATFIDLEHLMIPDVISLGGVISGVAASFFFPSLMGTTSRSAALFFSLGSATLGYVLLWGVLELGKMAFGRRKLRWSKASVFQLFKKEGALFLQLQSGLDKEEILLQEVLLRPSDQITAKTLSLEIGNERFDTASFTISCREISLPGRSWNLNEIFSMRAEIIELVLPREAMGFGDVKFLACIGAFLGVKGMIFSLFAGSIIGAIIGSLILLITRGRKGRCIPFGPYLALGTLLWFLG